MKLPTLVVPHTIISVMLLQTRIYGYSAQYDTTYRQSRCHIHYLAPPYYHRAALSYNCRLNHKYSLSLRIPCIIPFCRESYNVFLLQATIPLYLFPITYPLTFPYAVIVHFPIDFLAAVTFCRISRHIPRRISLLVYFHRITRSLLFIYANTYNHR